MNTLISAATLAVAVLVGALLGVTTLLLVVVFVCAVSAGHALVTREHRYLEQVGTPAPARVATAGVVTAAAAAVLVAAGPGLETLPARLLVAVALPAYAVRVLRNLWTYPGAGQTELALAAARDRAPKAALGVAAAAGVLLAAGTVLGIGVAGFPLLAVTVAAVAYGWRTAGRRNQTVEGLRATVANVCRIADPIHVAVEPEHWLAGSDDVLATAYAQLPRTWLPPSTEQTQTLLAEFAAVGWEAVLHPEPRLLDLARLEAVEPLPDRVELDPARTPDGLALLLGAGHTPDGQVGETLWDPDSADPHLLVAGPTRSGKSVLLRSLLVQAVNGSWDVLIADPKGVDYRWADNLPGVMRASGDHAYEALDAAVQEMKKRQAWLEEHAPATATNLGEVPDNPYPPMLVLIDETAELVELGGEGTPKQRKQRQDDTRQALGSLARRSRFVQIVMCVATQRPDATVIPGEVRGNLGTRVLTGQGEQQHKLMVFGGADVPDLPAGYPSGRARVMVGGAGPFEMQVPWITPERVLADHPVLDAAPDRPPADGDWPDTAGTAPDVEPDDPPDAEPDGPPLAFR